ncbi:MAG TPA: CDP-alcohol phosphatidyltransferase family protein [Natronosporangium sp.]
MGLVSTAQVQATYKQRDAWWTVLLVDPLAGRLLRLIAMARWVTPTRLTITAFLLGLGAAACFREATAGWLVAGALLYHASFVTDCIDGKLARLRGTGSVVGSWLDFLLDRIRVVVCTVALFGGQFLHTGNAVYLLTAVGVVFLALFVYLNGAETDRAKAKMAAQPSADRGAAGPSPAGLAAAVQSTPAGLNGFQVPSAVGRLARFLHRRRIRLNLVSGVEFEMAVFIVAPLVAAVAGSTAILWVTGVAAGLLICFELALIARFWLTARAFDRRATGRSLPTPRADQSGVQPRVRHPA